MLKPIRDAHEWMKAHPRTRRGLLILLGWAVGKLVCSQIPVEYAELCNSGARLFGLGG